MRIFTIDDFEPHVGEPFAADLGESSIDLLLDSVRAVPNSRRDGAGFRLQFRGPTEPILPQATYRLTRGGEDHDIFFVPIGQDSSGTLYEAVFN